ncbi:MAG: penicillin acylase family protein [Blastocatellia bacterium]
MLRRTLSLYFVFLLLTLSSFAQDKNLARSITIYRDSFGVPHIFGKTDAAVVFGLMYAQCEDNFWQLETDFIRSTGRAAELEGEKGLSGDLAYRAFEVERLSKAEYERLPKKAKELCEAYAAGLNYFLARNPQTKPRLITRFEPWHILAVNRSARIGNISRFGMNRGEIQFGEPLQYGAAPLQYGERQRPESPSNNPQIEAQVADAPRTASEPIEGSNMWAVAPSKSASGKALLFINPHVGFFGGGQRYEAHLHSDEGINVYGFAILGTPYIRSGFNQHLGWSHTNNYADTADAYVETFDDPKNPLAYRYGNGYRTAIEWTDEVKVKTDKGVEVRRYKFRKTHHGPIIGSRDGKQIAARVARMEEGGELRQRFAMNRARNFAEFKAALAQLAMTGSNTIYADDKGNIYYVHGNAVPKRSPKFDWTKHVDGGDPETEWQGYHTLDELPHLLNPKSGFLQNCNSTPFLMTDEGNPRKEDFSAYLAPEEDTPRAKSSRRILTSKAKFTFDEWTEAAADTTVDEAPPIITRMITAWSELREADKARFEKLAPAMKELADWKFVARTDSVPTTLFVLTHEKLKNKNDDPLQKLEETMRDLEKDFGTWRVAWGEINRLQRVHTSGDEPFSDERPSLPVAGGPGPAGIVFTYSARAEKGQKRRYGTAGNSFVAVVEFGRRLRAQSVLVFGQSPDPASKHHLDQAELYARGKFKAVRFRLNEIKANMERAYTP